MKYLKYIGICVGILLVAFLVVNSSSRMENSLQRQAQLDQKIEDVIFESKANNEGAVSITVLPKIVSDTGALEFAVTLSTHSVELREDLTQASVLLDGNGREHMPISWNGDPAGGHHRDGVLKFNPIVPVPQSITLQIRNVGGVDERSFSWKIQ